jgi:hypothetical protein
VPERHFPLAKPRACLACLLAALWLWGCAKPAPVAPPVAPGEVADLVRIPQDPAYFASGPDKDRELLAPPLAAALADDFFQAHFKPWRQNARPAAKRDVLGPFRQYAAAPGYGKSGAQNPPDFAPRLEALAGLGNYPNLGRPGLTLEPSDLRALPTETPSYLDPSKPGEGYPFDYLQYSRIPAQTPVMVRHASRDGQWFYVEMGSGQGWLPSRAVAFADEAFMAAFQTGAYAALIRENVAIPLNGTGAALRGGLGTVFPVKNRDASGLAGLAGVRDGAYARLVSFAVPAGLAEIVPMVATKASVAALARELSGQVYRWGGLDDGRDCSLMLRDLFTPLGVWLPRNSAAQAKAAPFVSLAGLSAREKEQAILDQAAPFATLIYLPGHIGLYVGAFEGAPVMFHNVWGVRTVSAGGGEGRKVIGRAVITTLAPGRELPDYDRGKSILERVEGMTMLGR